MKIFFSLFVFGYVAAEEGPKFELLEPEISSVGPEIGLELGEKAKKV